MISIDIERVVFAGRLVFGLAKGMYRDEGDGLPATLQVGCVVVEGNIVDG
jgi:hypothetical protein